MSNPNSINPDLREWDLDRTLGTVSDLIWGEDACDIITSDQEFRYPCCGFACVLTERILNGQGVLETQMMKRVIDVPAAGQVLTGEHSILRATTEEGHFYIDPSYSQFFEPLGLDMDFVHEGFDPFPAERAIIFKSDEVEDVITWLTDVIRLFWQKYNHSREYLERHYFSPQNADEEEYLTFFKPPLHMSDDDLRAYFGNIYDIDAYSPFQPSDELIQEAENAYSRLMVDTSGAYL